jgi:hypothetical protein
LPYPGFFSKIFFADIFVILDHVQFRKNSHHMRNTINGPNGPFNLCLSTKASYPCKICDVQLVNPDKVLKKHWRSIELSYKGYPYFKDFAADLRFIYQKSYKKLSCLNIDIIKLLIEIMEIKKPVYLSSQFIGECNLKKNDMLIYFCKKFDCNGYISGMGAINYIILDKFFENGITHIFDKYSPVSYNTPRGQSLQNMSILDMLFSIGPQKTKEIICQHHV